MTFFFTLLLGFALGCRHALDPDHVLAVSTIVARGKSVLRGAWIGAAWGIGHTASILAIGVPLVLSRRQIPAQLSAALELCVAAMLIWMGVSSLMQSRNSSSSPRSHDHLHDHGDFIHTHLHGHPKSGTSEISLTHSDCSSHGHRDETTAIGHVDRLARTLRGYNLLRPLIVGFVHGLAGSAGITILIMTSIREPLSALLYLLFFGIGTIFGMLLLTTVVALPIALSNRATGASIWLTRGISAASILFGVFLALQSIVAASTH